MDEVMIKGLRDDETKKLVIRRDEIKGRGVHAEEDIFRKEFVAEYSYKVYPQTLHATHNLPMDNWCWCSTILIN